MPRENGFRKWLDASGPLKKKSNKVYGWANQNSVLFPVCQHKARNAFKASCLSKLPIKDEMPCIPQMWSQYVAVWLSYNSVMDPNAKSNTLGYRVAFCFSPEELRIKKIRTCCSFHLKTATTELIHWRIYLYTVAFNNFSFKRYFILLLFTLKVAESNNPKNIN